MAFVGASVMGAQTRRSQSTCGVRMSMNADDAQVSRRQMLSVAAAAVAAFGVARGANAEMEYEGVMYLGGSDKIDVNNANIRAYTKYPGMYPNIAREIVKNGPFESVDDVLKIETLTATQKSVVEKYKNNLIALPSRPEYVIDKLNNGLYR
ncbi:Photosystem II 12 kDa extrinsic protein, chloroplastic [Porphyridium purpureum]|uniref:Photosystem II 12 kDa extrinsic protein n=1 Tax=Porphyridium purpureum TaxID=35688 RepID=A0A5J4YLQ6_PORPP|nr:Chain U6, PS II complex 12 kDa extrinsic protein [Porphyridium purpureum]7Y5E_UL Chain UL, PS II complex 12 kDa extrinsic protein [Porphyridium purpureum]7Y5E_u6 Chain u6, PS II complex 12 kDa extrinsic protein [Porphyridium purpureum]7Y5E_uL Chain uL, PS II complex 12 kDa extrinsic protein [Porphyridium purpureum]7Y7A_U9 Chain U9, PS II complex 12 kDa extrinsic protein [Porphyridium purpureum]7Y7A_UE Chain UE, PS II complex 12 kDa extrinsic protein [Porphyridium purpureum]7Y7A_UO Chain UO|eukprot:POR1987..scf244_11